MVARREGVCWFLLVLVTWLYLPCLGATSNTATTAAQWTLYSGLKLSWNEASMFCKSLGGHLPVFNTKLKWNGFNATALKWQKENMLLDDVWTGLFSQAPSAKPDTWEADCSLQPDGIDFWAPSEPDNLYTDMCIRYHLLTLSLRTWNCSSPFSIVCEFDKGSCRFTTGSPLQGMWLATTHLDATTAASCWDQCLIYPTTGSGEDCVGAMFLFDTCTAYLGETLLSASNPTFQSISSTQTMLKECFEENTTNIYSSYIFVDGTSTPHPAGDPCSTNKTSFIPVVPAPSITTGIQTTMLAYAQKTLSGIWDTLPFNSTTLSITSSTVDVTSSTLPYNDSTISPNSSLSITRSSVLIKSISLSSSNATLSNTSPTLQTNSSTSSSSNATKNSPTLQTNGSTSSFINATLQTSSSTLQNNSSTKSVTSSTLPAVRSGLTTVTIDISTSKESSLTKGFQPLLCPCIKYNNTFANMETPIIHRSNTSKYRRNLNSEWGSPSVYTSTSSASFVIVVGVAGFLFVVCDINRLTGFCNRKTPRKCRDTISATNLAT